KGWCGLVETAFIEPGTGMSPGAPEVIRSVLFYFRSMIYGYSNQWLITLREGATQHRMGSHRKVDKNVFHT
ncbi:hypothetical protein, partial [Roseibium sediminicola]